MYTYHHTQGLLYSTLCYVTLYVGNEKRFPFICFHGTCSALQNETLRTLVPGRLSATSGSFDFSFHNISVFAWKNPQADSSISSSHCYSNRDPGAVANQPKASLSHQNKAP